MTRRELQKDNRILFIDFYVIIDNSGQNLTVKAKYHTTNHDGAR